MSDELLSTTSPITVTTGEFRLLSVALISENSISRVLAGTSLEDEDSGSLLKAVAVVRLRNFRRCLIPVKRQAGLIQNVTVLENVFSCQTLVHRIMETLIVIRYDLVTTETQVHRH